MSNMRYWRVFKLTGISLAVVFLLAITMFFANGAWAQDNHPPVITSEPTLVVTTDQTYTYTVNSTDIDNDDVSYTLSKSPEGMSISGNEISWNPITTGMHNVVIQADDGNDGFDSQSWQIDVKPGDVRNIVVTPNDQPTLMTVDQTYQFQAKAYDNYGNLIEGANFSWTADGEFTTVDDNGVVTAVKPGIGFVKANIGDIQSAPGIVVKTAVPTDEEIANDITNSDSEEVMEENTEESTAEGEMEETELMTAVDENENEEDGVEDEVCDENINHSLTFVLLIIYAVILVIYFLYEKRHKSSSWWIFPLLISFIGLIVYYRYFCSGTYLWWPWVMVIIGVLITGYYKGRTESEDDISKNELPF